MNKTMRKLLSSVFAGALLLQLALPAAALAEDTTAATQPTAQPTMETPAQPLAADGSVQPRNAALDLTGLVTYRIDGDTHTVDASIADIVDSGEGWSWIAGSKTLTLKGATITSPDHVAITLPDGATIKLEGSNNTVTAGEGTTDPSLGIYGDGDIAIEGTGSLDVTSGTATGSSYGISTVAGTIHISGGTITATGGEATGGNSYGIATESGNVKISGGTVTAIGGKASATRSPNGNSYGIYTGQGVTVSGASKVTTTGGVAGRNSYGIYTGQGVDIDSSTVTAIGSAGKDRNHGIYAQNGNVTITDGTVIAESGKAVSFSYGIYTGKGVTITGASEVTATSGETTNGSSVGISASSNEVTITGGTVKATGGPARGSGSASRGIHSQSGAVNIENATVTAVGGAATVTGGESGGSYGISSGSGAVNLSGTHDVTARAGSVTVIGTGDAKGGSYGISSIISSVTISGTHNVIAEGGRVNVTAGSGVSYGIHSGRGAVTLSGSNVTATSDAVTGANEANGESCGVYAKAAVTFSAGKTAAKGVDSAVRSMNGGIAFGTDPVKMIIIDPAGGKIADDGKNIVTLSDTTETIATEAVIEQLYTLTLSGTSGDEATGEGQYMAGETVEIHAGKKDGYTFKDWTSSDGVTFADATSISTTVTMPAKNVTITANWTENDTPSDDDGPSDGGGTTTPPTGDTVTNPDGSTTTTTSDQTTGTVTKTTKNPDGSKVVTTTTQQKQPDGSTIKTETTVTTDKNGTIISATGTVETDSPTQLVKVPAQVIETLIKTQNATLSIRTLNATLTLDGTALQALAAKGGKTPAVSIAPVTVDKLPQAVQEKLKDAAVYSVNVNGGGMDFGGGTVTLSLDYARKDSGTVVAVYYVSDKGEMSKMPGSSFKDGKAIFSTGHFSFYAIQEETIPFTDVDVDSYYANAVLWATEKGITGGTSATTFSPDAVCTRAQVVTFLWRAMGSPAPAKAADPFTDVSADAYYYNAVLWAVEQGITGGTSATTFSPDAIVSRAQVVTFLHRAAKSPVVNYAMSFSDVDADAYYAESVRWAVSEGITGGTSATTFGPDDTCTRAQIVTFLFRHFGA